MLFNSHLFLLIFFPLVLLGYFGLNHFHKYRLALAYLLGMSLWFYGYNNPSYLLIIVVSILLNYACFWLIRSFYKKEQPNLSKACMILGVICNLAILGYFKYMDFFISNINSIFSSDYNLLHIALPLGISFFTFQQISFLVDAYHKEIQDVPLLDYACFVSYFPQLIAGPIVSHDEILPQLSNPEKKQFHIENFTAGFYLFVLGLAKKTQIADRFSDAVAYSYTTIANMNSSSAIICMVAYTIQIYFDFSGYCDMAMGLGKMMNIDIPLNFNSPYQAITIADFWDRWHITLTRFFRKYVYFPLGGSRAGKWKTYRNIMIVFLLSGLWHGADWRFVLWGAMHGLFLVLYRMFKKGFDALPKAINWCITFLFVNIAWVFFRAPSFEDALCVIKNVFAFRFTPFDTVIAQTFRIREIAKVLRVIRLEDYFPNIIMYGFFFVAFYFIFSRKNAYTRMQQFKPNLRTAIVTILLLCWCICSISGVQVFLYFNF